LNQLHSTCNSRINLKTYCPVCGEVSRDELVKGYEYAKDQYVIIDLDELEKLRAHDADKAIRIDTFIASSQIDPIYLSDTTYYLLPDGAAGQKPYRLLKEAMDRKQVCCIAKVVLHNREQLVIVRAMEGLLTMTVLRYKSQVKDPAAFRDELANTEVSAEERTLAETLIDETMSGEFDFSAYTDQYTERLTALIDAKVSGQEIVAPPEVETPRVVNLMDALRASVAQAQESRTPETSSTSRRKKASSKGVLAEQLAKPKKKAAKRKKKTGS
jgi:DNA end-binding protein Ku